MDSLKISSKNLSSINSGGVEIGDEPFQSHHKTLANQRQSTSGAGRLTVTNATSSTTVKPHQGDMQQHSSPHPSPSTTEATTSPEVSTSPPKILNDQLPTTSSTKILNDVFIKWKNYVLVVLLKVLTIFRITRNTSLLRKMNKDML